MRRIVLAAIILAYGLCGCTINQSLSLNKPMTFPAVASLRIRTLKVTAPAAGTNVFVFEDVTTGTTIVSTRPVAGGAITMISTVPAGLKRADFVYNLANDSAPMFSAALKYLLKEDQGSGVDAQLAADFKYGLMERRENVNLGWGNTNTIGIHMVAELILTSSGKVVLDKKYTAFESDSYSTRWMTIPSSDFLDTLFQKALRDISSQIASDSEVAESPHGFLIKNP